MAWFFSSGFDELHRDFGELGTYMRNELSGKMLEAGAEEIVKAWKETADKYGYDGSRDKATGEMKDSIGYRRSMTGAIEHCDVAPMGRGSNGTRNAEKAFLLHYGWSGYNGTHWVDEAENLGEGPAVDAMRIVMDEALAEKGF